MAVIPRQPLEWLNLFRQQMNEIFRYLSEIEGREDKDVLPLLDIYETPDAYVVEVELPGCQPGDVSLSVCCSALVVEGTVRQDAAPGVNYICLERSAGRFFRTIEIPPSADLNKAKARCERGLLTVVFPWCKEKTHIREIPIE